jgi:hypothetical protein
MSNLENEVTLQLERGIHSARNFIARPRGMNSALQYAVPPVAILRAEPVEE